MTMAPVEPFLHQGPFAINFGPPGWPAKMDVKMLRCKSNAWQIPVAAPGTPMDAMSEKPTEPSDAAFQEALLPEVDDSQFEEVKNNILDKMISLQQK